MLKIYLIILVFISIAFKAHSQIKTINIVFDINGVTMDGYNPTPGFHKLLSVLNANPRYKIYFFSTQSEQSIYEQIKLIKLDNGKRADEVASVVDGSYMTDFDSLQIRPRRYKDLRVIAEKPEDFKNTILIDDTFEKAHPNQRSNLLWLRGDVAYYSTLITSSTKTMKPDKTFLEILKSMFKSKPNFDLPVKKNKINKRAEFILGIIDSAVELAEQKNISVSEALFEMQWENSTQYKFSDVQLVGKYINRGEKAYYNLHNCNAKLDIAQDKNYD